MTDEVDPVHFNRVVMWKYDGTEEPIGWYFWDETWGFRYGPYADEAAAHVACREYGEQL